MKAQAGSHEWLYIHINSTQDYVMSYGIEFKEFYFALSERVDHLLLLKHQYEDSSFNMHTYLEYVERDEIKNLVKDDVSSYGDFCWIDFEDEAGLNEMTGQEIAEILYLSHMKHHLRMPFYRKLNNRFVYLSTEDGRMNRTYYREWEDFFHMMGVSLPLKWSAHRSGKGLIIWKKEKALPPIPKKVIMSISQLMKEGVIISLQHASNAKGKVEIPVWVVGDYGNMDDLQEDFKAKVKKEPAAWFIFDRKLKEWNATLLR
ncbi:hypothetical protein [Jeotgalibacillus soli]|uniref:hypothetical protein n=1 Tax=Jeotgalibacillus soli TaxID=889306 RepID=UPI0005978480|nr:hypothetical protein [Jeotgalibacillus soli]